MLFGHLYLLSCKENNKHFLSGLIFIHLQELYVLNMNLFIISLSCCIVLPKTSNTVSNINMRMGTLIWFLILKIYYSTFHSSVYDLCSIDAH